MIGLQLPDRTLDVLCLAAHPDDVEIGCGGLLLALEGRARIRTVVLTGTADRADEARLAAKSFGVDSLEHHELPDGRLPAHWGAVKQALADAADPCPDLVLAPRPDDSHQDHRLLGELVTTVWRDALVLHYEIPKWDGDLRPVTHYVALTAEQAHRKVRLLDECFPSQHGRDWWDEEMFLGLMRLRGIECRAPYAEGYLVRKALLVA
ncbi:MAG: PIG-L deacetylase family protein [Terrabacter sp.]